jgi:hypothetical protein
MARIKNLKIEDAIFKCHAIFADKTEHDINVTREEAVAYMLEHHKPRLVYDKKDGKTILDDNTLALNYVRLLEQKSKKTTSKKGGYREGAGRKPKDAVSTQSVHCMIRKDYLQIIARITDNRSEYIQKAVKEKLHRDGFV